MIDYAKNLPQFINYTPYTDKTTYEALRYFIATFASAESAVHLIARKISGLSDERARIIYGGMRLSDITDRVRQFINMDDMEPELRSEIDSCLTQLAHISAKRHNLVHRGATYFQGKLISTNSLTARSLHAIEVEHFDEGMLNDMAADCRSIFLRLVAITDQKGSDQKLIADLKARPWLYKHDPPKTPRQRRRKDRGSRKRQPVSSGE